jgi:hypothetical protein
MRAGTPFFIPSFTLFHVWRTTESFPDHVLFTLAHM